MRGRICLRILLLVVPAGSAFGQANFSADIVDLRKPRTPVLAKLAFTQDKRRLDMQAASEEGSIVMLLSERTKERPATEMRVGGTGRAIILNLVNHTSTLLAPDQKTFNTEPGHRLKPAELYGLYAIVHPANVDDACPEWMGAPNAEGETCKKIGVETVNGRIAVKYDLSCYKETCHLWIDRRLHVIVKRETKWKSTELRNIVEAPLDYSWFQIPPGYVEGKLGGIIQQSQPQ